MCRDCGEADRRSAAERDSVDAVLYQLQGKAEGVTYTCSRTNFDQLLTDFAAERLALIQRHEAGARVVSHYDFNNTYQYVIAREETHLSWLRTALERAGRCRCRQPSSDASGAAPCRRRQEGERRGLPRHSRRTTRGISARSSSGGAPQVATVTHARHRTMLGVVLGESLEHQRLFEQAAAGMRRRDRQAHERRRARRRRAARRAGRSKRSSAVAIALGSNLGDREALSARRARRAAPVHPVSARLEFSRHRSRRRRRRSPSSSTPPRSGRRRCRRTTLLDTLLDIEKRFGRERPFPGAPRTLDLDLILYGDDDHRRGRSRRAASAVSRAAVRAGAAGGDRRRLARPGDRANGGGVACGC